MEGKKLSKLKNKTKTIPEILQKWELGLIPKDSKVVSLEDAEKEISHLTNLLKQVCEQGYEYETEMEGKVEQFRKWLDLMYSASVTVSFDDAREKFAEVFGEKKNE